MSAAPAINNPAYIDTNDFEPIYVALFKLLDGCLTPISQKWMTSGRLLRHWSEVEGKYQPAMFMAQVDEDVKKRVGQLPQWILRVLVYVYCQAKDDRSPTDPVMNPLIGAVRTALQPDRTGRGGAMNQNTLGGLVFDVYIDGKIETSEGVLGQQAVAKIPVRVIVNGP